MTDKERLLQSSFNVDQYRGRQAFNELVWIDDRFSNVKMTHATFSPAAAAFRFYNDGTESGSTPIAAQDTNITPTITGNTIIQLRYRIDETGGASGATTDDYGLEYSVNSGSFNPVTTSSNRVICVDSANLTDGNATTNRGTNGITDGSGTFVAGQIDEANGIIDNHQLTANNFTEHLFSIQLTKADFTTGDTVDFRVTLNGGNPGMTNSVTPRITVTVSNFVADAVGFRFFTEGTETGGGPMAAENTNMSYRMTGGNPIILRYQIRETGGDNGLTTDDYQLQVSRNSGAWNDVTSSSLYIKLYSSSRLTNGAATTNRSDGITDPSGSFVAGKQLKTGTTGIVDFQLTANNFTEHVFGIQLDYANLTDGDTLDFRMTLNGGTPGMTNTVAPRLTITKVTNHTSQQRRFRFYADGTESGSSPLANEDTNINVDVTSGDQQVHIRFMIRELSGSDGATHDFFYLIASVNSGAYADVTFMDPSSGLVDGAATTNRATDGITDDTGTFLAGFQKENDNFYNGWQLTANNYTEHVFALLIPQSFNNGDTIDLRLERNGAGFMAYFITPRITIQKTISAVPNALMMMGHGL